LSRLRERQAQTNGRARGGRRAMRWLPLFAFLATAPLATGQQARGWEPPPPPPDESDWVQLTSGEWLKGEIIDLYRKELAFDSDELDLQVLDWEDVKELRSAAPMRVSFEDGQVVTGPILVDERAIRVLGEPDRQFPRAAIVTIARASAGELDRWSAKAALGANLRSGNTEQVELTGKAKLVRRSVKDRLTLELLGTFNRTDGTVAADNQRATASWGHVLSKRLSWAPLFAEWFRDPFTNVDRRWTLGTGLRSEIVDTKLTSLEIAAGLAYQANRYVDVPPQASRSVETPALVLQVAYEQELTRWLDFNVDHRSYIVNAASGEYTHHLVTGLEIELTSVLDLDVTFTWDRIQSPQADSEGAVPKRDDLRLALLFGVDF